MDIIPTASTKGKSRSAQGRQAIGEASRAYWAERARTGNKRTRSPETIRKFALAISGRKKNAEGKFTREHLEP